MTNEENNVQRADSPTIDQFLDLTASNSRPLILTGIVRSWPAFTLWNRDYLLSRMKSLPVVVSVSSDGIFGADPATGFSIAQERMSFSQSLKLVEQGGAEGQKYYITQNNIDLGPFLLISRDFTNPIYIPPNSTVQRNFWFGPAQVTTPLHFDRTNNLFAQIAGEKRIVLFAPEQSEYLYPHPQDSKIFHLSQVDIRNPDAKRFPRFREARSIEVVVRGGEMLFIPAGWWHQVYSETESISVNFWWSTEPTPHLKRDAQTV